MTGSAAVDVAGGPAPTGAVPPQAAVIFDMDGVVTDTAGLHARARKRLFDGVLTDPRAARVAGKQAPFDITLDYRRYVDGRAREDGVAAFLAARGLELPRGTPEDPRVLGRCTGWRCNNDIFRELLSEHGVRVFAGTVDLIRWLRAGRVSVALVTASRNARELLTAAGLATVFGGGGRRAGRRRCRPAWQARPGHVLGSRTQARVSPRPAPRW